LKNEGHFETEEMKNTDLPNLRISIKKSKYKKYYDRLSDWNQGMTNKREHRDSCNYVRVTWASDPRMRRERKKCEQL